MPFSSVFRHRFRAGSRHAYTKWADGWMIFLTRACRGARSFDCAWAITASSTPSTSAGTNFHSLRSATGAKSIAFDGFISAGEMQGQFQAIQNNFDDLRARRFLLFPVKRGAGLVTAPLGAPRL